MARFAVLAASFALIAACRSSQQAATVEAKKDAKPAAASADAGARDAEVADAGAIAVPMGLQQYRVDLLRELMRLTRSREATVAAEDVIHAEAATIPHSIEVLKRIGQAEAYVVASAGYGRLPHGRRKNAHVELLAYVDQYGAKIGQVLEAIGDAMHARGEHEEAWKEYTAVELPEAKHGMQYFDLRPAGEVAIAPDLRVTLLKVMPMSREEFERSQENPAGEWDDPNAAARALQRWRRLLEQK